MPPNPELVRDDPPPVQPTTFPKFTDESIVISGMSGRFPKSRTIADFKENLFNKIDMVEPCDDQWKAINEVVPDRYGRTLDIGKFDSAFFSIHAEFGNYMDPQGRMILEHVYEAILDSGISPKSLRGSNTGVFLGCCFVDSHEACIRDRSGKELTGSLRTLLANHISYVMDFKGPSFVIDTACSSSGYAADVALKALQNGECDQAILAGTNLLLGPTLSLVFLRMGVLSKDGHSRSFDEDASGYCRADAIVALFLQKSKDAKRIYGRFIHGKKNVDGFKKEGFPFPSRVMQIKLFEDFYREIGVDPSTVDYIEAHSTGTKVGDPEECSGLDQIFCKNRTKPLLLGSVKSNMGHSEGASTSCSIVKSLLAFENRKLPPNLHLNKIRSGIPAFEEGRIKVVDEVQEFDGSLIGINSFGVGGANVHLLLQAHDKEKVNNGLPSDDLPRLVLWSGRSEEAVNSIFDNLEKTPIDVEHIALLQNTQVSTAVLNTYRGYGIFKHDQGSDTAKCIGRAVMNFLDSKRPVVWVYTGMGAQWTQMLSDLQRIPIFNAAIIKCHNILLTKNLNLIEILSSPDESLLSNVLHAYVGIAAIQIGLTDILRALDIQPDYIIGHSVGELGCAYADGCNSLEEVILAAYSRGMATIETKIIHGAMAAIGIGHEELKDMLIEGIEIACHNYSNSSTISGPAEVVTAFVEKLKSEKIFAKEVNSSNIPYHSSYISQMGPKLLARLKDIIKSPKVRSSKWLSTSIPKDKWDNEGSNMSSAEYHTNNLLNPVLFQEALEMLPKDALTIEVAPCGLLQTILRRAIPDGVHFSLTKKDEKENCVHLMNSLGRIFQNGTDMDISKLYPPVEFPVSRGTPMISPHIKWDHSQNYDQFKIEDIEVNEMKAVLQLRDPNVDFLTGHKIEGKMIFPATGYLYLACRLAAAHYKKKFEEFDVEFEDIKFLNACFLSYEKDTALNIVFQGGDGRFEVREGKTLMCTGFIRPTTAKLSPFVKPDNSAVQDMNTEDFYRELRVRGYHYEKMFKSVVSVKIDGSEAKVLWQNNWIAFMDNLAQMMLLRKDLRTPVVPTRFRKAILKPSEYLEGLKKLQNTTQDVYATAYYVPELDMIRCDGMEFRGFGFLPIPKRPQVGNLVLQNYQFISYNPTPIMSEADAAGFCVQLALENSQLLKIKSVEVDCGDEKSILNTHFATAIENVPIVAADLTYFTDKEFETKPLGVDIKKLDGFEKTSQVDFIINSNILMKSDFLAKMQEMLNEGGFLISREIKEVDLTSSNIPENFKFIAKIQLETENIFVLRLSKDPVLIPSTSINVSATEYEKFSWLEKVKDKFKTEPVILFSEGEKESGILGLVNCIRREPNGNNIKCIFIDDENAPEFDPANDFYKKQLEKGLAINVYRNGQWGSYRHLNLKPSLLKEVTPNTMAVAELSSRGDFSSLKWFESPLKFNYKDEIITVHYAALNFRDIMHGSGRIPTSLFGDLRIHQQQIFGFEYSGVTSKGRRVMGIVPKSALATHVIPDDVVVMDLPNDWKMEEGTTVFATYGTAFLGLFVRSELKKEHSILIHAGSGGVGLSAIHIAHAMGVEIFTTVSTEEKKNYLLELFPNLKPENVGNSRDTSFEDMVMKNTNGKGVDFVLNSLADDKLLASLRCMKKGGTFIEIGKSDIFRDNKINLGHFIKEITFLSINIDVFVTAGKEHKKKFLDYMKEGVKKGLIKPLKTTVFDGNQLEEAFRFLASGKHIGKVVLKIRDEDDLLIKEVVPRVFFDDRKTYIICGGLGGFGMELADWMIIKGCRKIVLSSSRGVLSGYNEYRFSLWRTYGVEIQISTADITTLSGCYQLLSESSQLGTVGGIFNLAAKLNDAILENQTVESFEQCMAAKAVATKFLDEASRKMCRYLEHFVVFSSVSCGLGNAGQSNYGMANSIMERIVEGRHREGLPAKAIQWGAIGDVGIVARIMEEKKASADMEISGTMMQSIYSCLEVLDSLLTSEDPIVTSMVVAEKLSASGGRAGMLQQLLKVLGIKDVNAYPKDTKIVDFGMDSLLTVEVLQHAERELNVQLTVDDLRAMTIAELIELTKEDAKPFVAKKPAGDVDGKSEKKEEEENVTDVIA